MSDLKDTKIKFYQSGGEVEKDRLLFPKNLDTIKEGKLDEKCKLVKT